MIDILTDILTDILRWAAAIVLFLLIAALWQRPRL